MPFPPICNGGPGTALPNRASDITVCFRSISSMFRLVVSRCVCCEARADLRSEKESFCCASSAPHALLASVAKLSARMLISLLTVIACDSVLSSLARGFSFSFSTLAFSLVSSSINLEAWAVMAVEKRPSRSATIASADAMRLLSIAGTDSAALLLLLKALMAASISVWTNATMSSLTRPVNSTIAASTS